LRNEELPAFLRPGKWHIPPSQPELDCKLLEVLVAAWKTTFTDQDKTHKQTELGNYRLRDFTGKANDEMTKLHTKK
jgi:hypothetical protein